MNEEAIACVGPQLQKNKKALFTTIDNVVGKMLVYLIS